MNQVKKAVFIRHNLSSTSEILNDLWRRREIAVHFEDNRSTSPEDYKSKAAKIALNRLHSYCEMGVVVGAVYRKVQPSHILVGIIPPGSKIYSTDRYGDQYIYKIVQLQNAKEIPLADYPILAAIQPKLATIIGWPSAFDVLSGIAFDKTRAPNVKNLSPGELDVLCQEYLRMKGMLKALLLPIGRNLKDVDIVGVGEGGCEILAQVTHSNSPSEVHRKLQALNDYKGQNLKLMFFGPEAGREAVTGVDYISIENVFADLQSSQDTVYPQMIEMMFRKHK